MQLFKIIITKQRGKSPYIDYCNDEIKCIQQSNFSADNDWLEFLKPMAEYIAQELFIK